MYNLVKEGKCPFFTLEFSSNLVFNQANHPHIIIVTGLPTVTGRDLNPEPISLEECAILGELTSIWWNMSYMVPIVGLSRLAYVLDYSPTYTAIDVWLVTAT